MGLPATGGAIMIPSRHRLAFAIVAAICATVIAACGSSTKPSTTAGSSQVTMLDKYSACMRDHGVSGFPDPSTTETPNSFGIDGYTFDLPSTMSTQAPAYQSANKTCQSVLSSGTSNGLPAGALAKARQHAVAHAECMRKHGVPNFPDPTVTGSGNGITQSSGGPGAGINPRSPAFQQAEKICGGG